MNPVVVRLDQIMFQLLTLNKYCLLTLQLRFAHAKFVHAKRNLIKFILYNNWSTQVVNNISESPMSNSSKPIKFGHRQKSSNQSNLNSTHVIEITNTCTDALMKARNSLLFDVERNVSIGKKQKMVKIFFKSSF